MQSLFQRRIGGVSAWVSGIWSVNVAYKIQYPVLQISLSKFDRTAHYQELAVQRISFAILRWNRQTNISWNK